MKRCLLVFVFIIVLAGLSLAQNQADDYNKAEVFAGYSVASLYTGDDFKPIENGFEVSAVYNVRRYFGIKADFSGTFKKVEGDYLSSTTSNRLGRYRADHSLYNAAVGVQFKNNRREAGSQTIRTYFSRTWNAHGQVQNSLSVRCGLSAFRC